MLYLLQRPVLLLVLAESNWVKVWTLQHTRVSLQRGRKCVSVAGVRMHVPVAKPGQLSGRLRLQRGLPHPSHCLTKTCKRDAEAKLHLLS